ncbi:hypothetical protein OJF2_11870 [Aquisphaera giovannonii]|uniref:Uncharacterized protein n=1 Tax=Aquisphaera giovannonii TaxID=406548 RepID=A0A5B9VWS1_9BACT|nr:hypothetical protein [Aquisphaera giovannonii]QEH32708.1 hypothetical protein OJF2_11870 [Aquisphaera giovannonii]
MVPRSRFRFTIRALILAVALVALNLAAVRAIVKEEWRGGASLAFKGNAVLEKLDARDEEGVACRYGLVRMSDGSYRIRIREVWRFPRPQTPFQVFSLVICSLSITCLVLTLYAWELGVPLRDGSPGDKGSQQALAARIWLGVRWIVLAVALIVSNVAASRYQPIYDLYETGPPDRAAGDLADWAVQRPHKFVLKLADNSRPEYRRQVALVGAADVGLAVDLQDLFHATPRVLNLAVDGTMVERCALDSEGAAQTRLPAVLFFSSLTNEVTIDFKADGAIVGSMGMPGEEGSSRRVIRPPTFSFLERRWPLIGSVSMSVVALSLTLRRLSRRKLSMLSIALILAVVNVPAAMACLPHDSPRLLSQTWGMAVSGELYFSDGTRRTYERKPGAPMRITRIEISEGTPSRRISWSVIAGPLASILFIVIWRSWARPS